MPEHLPGALKTYPVKCEDGTEGRISARNDEGAREMADEMCEVHKGVQKQKTEFRG